MNKDKPGFKLSTSVMMAIMTIPVKVYALYLFWGTGVEKILLPLLVVIIILAIIVVIMDMKKYKENKSKYGKGSI